MSININRVIYKKVYKYFEIERKKGLFYTIKRFPRFIFHCFWNIVIDYPLNIILGHQQTQKLYFAAFKFRCNNNLFLKKKNLCFGQTTLRNLYKVSYIDPSKIEYILDQEGTSFYIEDGDWDLKKRKLQLHPTIKELFVDGVPYQKTQQ